MTHTDTNIPTNAASVVTVDTDSVADVNIAADTNAATVPTKIFDFSGFQALGAAPPLAGIGDRGLENTDDENLESSNGLTDNDAQNKPTRKDMGVLVSPVTQGDWPKLMEVTLDQLPANDKISADPPSSDLVQSCMDLGVLINPPSVEVNPAGQVVAIIAGRRRILAARQAVSKSPVPLPKLERLYVTAWPEGTEHAPIILMDENYQRSHNPLAALEAIEVLQARGHDATWIQFACKIPPQVYRSLVLLQRLIPEWRDAWRTKKIKGSVARLIARLEDHEKQRYYYELTSESDHRVIADDVRSWIRTHKNAQFTEVASTGVFNGPPPPTGETRDLEAEVEQARRPWIEVFNELTQEYTERIQAIIPADAPKSFHTQVENVIKAAERYAMKQAEIHAETI